MFEKARAGGRGYMYFLYYAYIVSVNGWVCLVQKSVLDVLGQTKSFYFILFYTDFTPLV